jgi:hypothetical protein
MNWFRSNIRLGSRLALAALAIQLLLSFGHFHDSYARAAPALADAKQSGLRTPVDFAAAHSDASDRATQVNAIRPVGSKNSSDHERDGRPSDDCAICAVMAQAHATVGATPPDVLGPQAAAFLYLTTDARFADPNSARVAFQPRAPPIS